MTLHLGDLQQQQPVSVLFELLAPPAPRLGNTSIQRIRLAQLQAMADEMSSATSLDLLVNYTANPQPTPDMVLDAAARANAMRLQRRALEAAARGEHTTAVQLLRSVAARLKELGEPGLASIALREAEALEHTGHTTRLGAKELTYSTRRLGKG
jgi:hypothetical protein